MNAAMAAPPSPLHSILLISRGVWIETIRRKEFYVLLILMGLFVAGAFIIQMIGAEDASTSNFLFNLGLSLSVYAAHLLGLLSSARQVPTDTEARTLYPILAKPVSRGQYIIGKWFASSVSACITLTLLFIMTGLVQLVLPQGHPLNAWTLLQSVPLLFLSIALLCALSLLGSLLFPQGVNLVGVALIFFSGEQVVGFVRARAVGSPYEQLTRWFTAYLPSFDHLNLVTRYTDGIGPVPALEYLGLIGYAAIVSGFLLMFSVTLFQRRSL